MRMYIEKRIDILIFYTNLYLHKNCDIKIILVNIITRRK